MNFELKTWKSRAFRLKILRKSDLWCSGNGFPNRKTPDQGFCDPDIGSTLLWLTFSHGDKRSRRYLCFYSNDFWGRWFWILSWTLESLEHFVWKSFVNPIFVGVEMGFLIVKSTNHAFVTLTSIVRDRSLLLVMGISDRGVIIVSTVMIIGGVDFEFWVENLKV